MYNSKYYTCEQIDQRLLEGYYDDAVAAGYTGSKAQYLAGLLKAINYSANPNITADKVVYNHAISGLTSKNVQEAIDDVCSKLSDLSNNFTGFSKSFTFDKESNNQVELNDVKFKKGQYACIMVKTTPAISTVYNGNATNMGEPYPSISITDGFGEIILGPATSGNAFLGYFGYPSVSSVPIGHTTDFTIFVMESADELPIKVLTQQNTEYIQKNTEDIQKNTEDIQQNTEYIQKVNSELNIPIIEKSIGYNFSESEFLCIINTRVIKSGQYIKVKVKTTPAITTTYLGNARDMTQPYPHIDIENGIGEVIIGPATSDNGTLLNFGYSSSSSVTAAHKAEFIIGVFNSNHAVTLKEQVQKNTEDIQQNTIQWQPEGIIQYPTSDEFLKGNFRVPGYTAIIRSWGFIGDSLCSGEMECYEGSVKKFIDMYEYSWGQQICRLCGSEGYNYSSGGQTAKGWINSSGERAWAKAKTTPHQAYIIALGVNDAAQTTVGNVETDVDFDNYENNADTFAGNYFGIIQRIRSISKRSIIFVVTDPRDNNLNEIIKKVPSKFEKVFLIDLTSLIPLYSNTEFIKKYKMGFHMNATGYLYTAYIFMHYIDCIIQKNPSIFKDIALWNTNYTAQAT